METALLRSIVDATVGIFRAEAASIALLDEASGNLKFVVAAGAQGEPVVGLTIPPTQGLAGYVFSTGESIALSDPSNDPRFGRGVAESTGFMPRSILAVPLEDGDRTVGVLEVIDKLDGPFSMEDIGIASLFARQAATAIRVAARAREIRIVLADVLASDEDDPRRRRGPRAGLRRDAPARRRRPLLGVRRRHRGHAPRLAGRSRPRHRAPAGHRPARRGDQPGSDGTAASRPTMTSKQMPAWSEPFQTDRRGGLEAGRTGHRRRRAARLARRTRRGRDRRDHRFGRRRRPPGGRRQAHPEPAGRPDARGTGRRRRRGGARRRRARHRLRRDHPRPRARGGHHLDPGPQPRQQGQGDSPSRMPSTGWSRTASGSRT